MARLVDQTRVKMSKCAIILDKLEHGALGYIFFLKEHRA